MFATAKSIELIGFATINVVLAMVLSATFLSGPMRMAAGDRLSTSVVTDFVNQMTRVSTGNKANSDIFMANKFLQEHIGQDTTFKTSIAYDLPDIDDAERHLTLTKKDYINNVLKGLKSAQPEKTSTSIESIEIAPDAHHANVITTTYERGPMPIQTGDRQQIVQVTASSYCEQAITLRNKKIVIDSATCSTNVLPAKHE